MLDLIEEQLVEAQTGCIQLDEIPEKRQQRKTFKEMPTAALLS